MSSVSPSMQCISKQTYMVVAHDTLHIFSVRPEDKVAGTTGALYSCQPMAS